MIMLGIYLMPLLLNASWVEQYQKGEYPKSSSFVYAMTQVDVNTKEYAKIAQKEAIADIATQIYSQVSSDQSLIDEVVNDERSQSFSKNIHIISDIPIHGAIKEQETLQDHRYYLLLSLDMHTAGPVYKREAQRLSGAIDKAYKDCLNEKSLHEKERLLNLIARDFANYEKYALVARLMKQQEITQPSVSAYAIDKALAGLYKTVASDPDELASLIGKRLFKKKIKQSVKVLPFSYEGSGTFSAFSSEFQSYLENSVAKMARITKAHESVYKLAGNYYLKDGYLVANAQLYDNSGHIRATAIAKMKRDAKNKAYYRPKKNAYGSMNEAVLSDKFTVQARINGQKDNLLFKKGETLKLEVKVSQEAYLYIIANMRTKKGRQIQYLLPVSNVHGKAQYSKFIPYQNSNLWITLEEFEVYAPFGAEALHIFSASQNILDRLPLFSTQKIDGEMYDGVIVGRNNAALPASRSISQVRGLKRKSKTSKAMQMSETVLKFTTVRK